MFPISCGRKHKLPQLRGLPEPERLMVWGSTIQGETCIRRWFPLPENFQRCSWMSAAGRQKSKGRQGVGMGALAHVTQFCRKSRTQASFCLAFKISQIF